MTGSTSRNPEYETGAEPTNRKYRTRASQRRPRRKQLARIGRSAPLKILLDEYSLRKEEVKEKGGRGGRGRRGKRRKKRKKERRRRKRRKKRKKRRNGGLDSHTIMKNYLWGYFPKIAPWKWCACRRFFSHLYLPLPVEDCLPECR
ncbi:hypothetical protein E2C01_046952 [Portunus trituberculatus]|uniref:Uncharacterized protein n=1 Tax=Portunus trituberculatus TaxID=210409 RepID=A0A5B7G7I3_PORTR|nr:hypothetical protein [Portunus trituberculatus]